MCKMILTITQCGPFVIRLRDAASGWMRAEQAYLDDGRVTDETGLEK
jgi:hypothetical protein